MIKIYLFKLQLKISFQKLISPSLVSLSHELQNRYNRCNCYITQICQYACDMQIMICIVKRKYLLLKFIDDENDFFVERGFCNAFLSHASEYVRSFVHPCVRACMRACVHACVSEIPKSSDYLLLFLHLSPPPPPAPPFSPSFSSSRKPLAGSERSSSPAAINLFRDELSRSSSPSLGLAILRFCDSSKEHPLGISAKSRRRRNCHAIQSY